MADTYLSRADALALLTAGAGSITAQDIRDIEISRSQYAGILFSDFTTSADILGVTTTAEQITVFDTNSNDAGAVSDQANDRLVAEVDGDYLISIGASFGGDSNVTFDFIAYGGVDGATVATECKFRRKLGSGGGGDIGRAAAQAIVPLNAGDVVECWIASNQGGGADATIANLTLTAQLL